MKFFRTINLKLILAITVAVAVVSVSGGYVTLTSVNALSLRLRTLYDDSVLPLSLATQASEECHEMNLAACRTLTAEGDKRQLAVEQLKQFQNSFDRHVAKYASELTVGTQPAMQELLRKYGALEDQTTREQHALDVVQRTIPVLKRSLDQMFELLRQGSRREAIAFYDRDLTAHFNAIQHQIEILGNAIPFVVAAAERDPPVETAEHDGPAGGVNGFDPPHGAAGYQDACDPREDEYQRDTEEHGHLDVAGKAI